MVTLKDIAKKTGLSLPTVSHILSKRGDLYSDDTRQRVVEAAEEMGYRPNTSARAIRTGRFGTLALLMSSDPDRSGLFSPLVNGIHDSLDEHDLHLTLARLPDAKLTDPDFVPRILKEWMADGMLMLYNSQIPPRLQELIEQFKIPSIWINTKQAADCIYPNEFKAGYDATRRLLAGSGRPVWYCDFTHGFRGTGLHFSTTDRRQGYEKAMEEAGRQPRWLGVGHRIERDQRLAYCLEWMGREDHPAGVLASTPSSGLPLCHAATRRGLELGKDLSLLTFGNGRVNDTGLEVAAMMVPMYEMGRQSVELLRAKIASPRKKLKPVVLEHTFCRGGTLPSET